MHSRSASGRMVPLPRRGQWLRTQGTQAGRVRRSRRWPGPSGSGAAAGHRHPTATPSGVLTAAARCIGPLSLVRSQRHCRQSGRQGRQAAASAEISSSAARRPARSVPLSSVPPNTITRCPASTRRLTIWRNRSGSHLGRGRDCRGTRRQRRASKGRSAARCPRRVVERDQWNRRLSRASAPVTSEHVGCASVHRVDLASGQLDRSAAAAASVLESAPLGDAGRATSSADENDRSEQGGRGPRPASQLADASAQPPAPASER